MKTETLIILIGVILLLLVISQKVVVKPEVALPPKVKRPIMTPVGKLLLIEEITQA